MEDRRGLTKSRRTPWSARMNVDGPTEFILFPEPLGPRSADTPTHRADGAQYFRARSKAERTAAKLATSPEARQRHHELARAYESLSPASGSEGNQ